VGQSPALAEGVVEGETEAGVEEGAVVKAGAVVEVSGVADRVGVVEPPPFAHAASANARLTTHIVTRTRRRLPDRSDLIASRAP
jgi:hypothetical protein